jgi:hypothetical protein
MITSLALCISITACDVDESDSSSALVNPLADVDWNAAPTSTQPAPYLLELSSTDLSAGETASWTVTGAEPFEVVVLIRGGEVGFGACPAILSGLCVDTIGFVEVADFGVANQFGEITFERTIPAIAAVGQAPVYQALAVRGAGGADSVKSNTTREAVTDGSARFRVVYNSPDAPAVDLYANGDTTPLATNVAFGDVTGYLAVPAGTYEVEVRAAGDSPTNPPVYSQALTVDAATDYTTMASGFLTSTDPSDSFRILAFQEDFASPEACSARVRIVHGSPDAPPVAIDVGNDGTPEINDLALFADTGADGVALPAGEALQIGIWAGSPLTRVTAFTTPELACGEEMFVVASGELGRLPREETGFNLLAMDRDGLIGAIQQNPVVYALHASPDAPAVDIFAGEAELIADLAFGEISGAVQVPPGAYGLDFYGATAGTAPVGAPAASADTPDLAPGERYLAIATGFLSGTPGFQLLPVADGFDVADADARVRVVHASPDAFPVDVGVVAGAAFTPISDISDLAFTESSDAAGLSLAPGVYDFGIGEANTGSAAFSFSGLELFAEDRLFAIGAGSAGAGTFQLMLVVADDGGDWQVLSVLPD